MVSTDKLSLLTLLLRCCCVLRLRVGQCSSALPTWMVNFVTDLSVAVTICAAVVV